MSNPQQQLLENIANHLSQTILLSQVQGPQDLDWLQTTSLGVLLASQHALHIERIDSATHVPVTVEDRLTAAAFVAANWDPCPCDQPEPIIIGRRKTRTGEKVVALMLVEVSE